MKQNNWFKTIMKIWISLVSVIAFLFGWILFGHSQKPATASANAGSSSGGSSSSDPSLQITPLPTLAPLPPVGSSSGSQIQSQPQQSFNFSIPSPNFRSRGS